MGGAIGIIVVLYLLWIVYSLLLGQRTARGDDGPGNTRFGLQYTQRGDLWRGYLDGVVLLFALATIVGAGFDVLSALIVGAAIALGAGVAGLISGIGRLFVQMGYSAVGLAASAILLTRLFDEDNACGGVDPGLRTGVVIALIVVWALSLGVGIFGSRLASVLVHRYFSRWHASSGLALFGALDVIVLAAGPVGLGVGDAGVTVIFWGVAVIGLLTGVVPELVLLTCALALSVLSVVAVYTPIAAGCDGAGSSVPVAMLLGYVACAAVLSRLFVRRSRRFG